MPDYTLAEIAKSLGLEAQGDASLRVSALAEPADAGPSDLALAMKPEFVDALGRGCARAALLADGTDWQALGLAGAILAPRPRYALSGVSAMLDPGEGWGGGVHPTAFVDPSADIAPNVSIGPMSVIGPRARLGTGTVLGPQCFVGAQAQLGDGAILREAVRIAARVRIGARFRAQPGAVIGGDGFSFVTPEQSGVERARKTMGDQGAADAQTWARIHSLGSVEIGDDVEVGANSCIDRGTIRATRIGAGTKIDNLVQVGHNVVIGRNCLLCGSVGIAGSTIIGDQVVLGGQVGVCDNLKIGDNVIAGAGTLIMSNVPAGRVMLGYPAMKMEAHVDSYKGFRRLPRLYRDVAALKKAVFNPGASD